MDRRGGGRDGGGGFGRDLRERDRGSAHRDNGYPDRRVGHLGAMDYRDSEGMSGRGDDRYAGRDRERDRAYDPRAGESRFESRDAGASRFTEPSRYRLGLGNQLLLSREYASLSCHADWGCTLLAAG